jgi:hypothetical protein
MKVLCSQACTNEHFTGTYREELKFLIKEKNHRRSFLNHINKFRATGSFKLERIIIENIGLIMNDILDEINLVKDYENAKYCLILSQTYFYQDDRKYYLQEKIDNHTLLKQLDFWETYIACILF